MTRAWGSGTQPRKPLTVDRDRWEDKSRAERGGEGGGGGAEGTLAPGRGQGMRQGQRERRPAWGARPPVWACRIPGAGCSAEGRGQSGRLQPSAQASRAPGERPFRGWRGSAPGALQGASAFQATCALGKALRLPPRPHGEAARHLPSPLSRPWVQELQRARWLPRLPEESKPKMNAGPPMARCAPLPTSEATLPTPEKEDASAPFPPPSDSRC